MNERFKSIFEMKPYMYVSRVPVLISAGRMLWDNFTNRPCVQLKLQSISTKIIQSVTVKIDLLDYAGNLIGQETQEYNQLDVARDQFFGEQEVIQLNDTNATSFSANIAEVVLYDRTVVVSGEELSKHLPELKPLRLVLNNDVELEKQFQIENGYDHKYAPVMEDVIWRCSCGAINNKNELVCHACGMPVERDFQANIDDLKNRRDVRIKKESEERVQRDKKRNLNIVTGAIVFTTIIIIIAIINLLILPSIRYKQAKDAYASEEYESAYELFKKNGNFKDSNKMSINSKQKYWIDEYGKILEYGYKIETMDAISTVNSNAVFGLAFINDDDIPELCVSTDDELCYIYSIIEDDDYLLEPTIVNESLARYTNENYEIGYYEKGNYVYEMYADSMGDYKSQCWMELGNFETYVGKTFSIYTSTGFFSGETKEYQIDWSDENSEYYGEEEFYKHLKENVNSNDYKRFKLYNNTKSNRENQLI